jgi:hypothetical protein
MHSIQRRKYESEIYFKQFSVYVVNTSWSLPHSLLITRFVTRFTRRVSLVEQKLSTLPEHLSSPPVFSGVRVTRSLVLCVCFVDRCLSFCPFSFGHCLFFFDLRIQITPLVSSNSSCRYNKHQNKFRQMLI